MIIEITKVFLGPLVALILGILLIRRVENVKAQVARQSNFSTKWAESYYLHIQEYMKAIERYLSLLHHLQSIKKQDDPRYKKIIEELNEFHVTIPETQLKLRRYSIFAPIHGPELVQLSNEIQDRITAMIKSSKGNLDEVIELINKFSQTAKLAHSEMLQ